MADALNRNSFVRVYSGASKISLPVIPLREPGLISPPIIFVPGESLSFYIAAAVGGGLTLTNGSGGSFGGGGSISSFSTTPEYGTHSVMNVTVPSVPDGTYKMTVGGMESNYVEVISDVALANQISAFFEVSHNKPIDVFRYPYAGEGYKQKMRLRLTVVDMQPETNIDGYEATNTGKQRNLQGVSKKYVTFQTPDYQLEDHDAMHVLSLHDNILINGKSYIRRPSGSYKMSPAMDTPVSNGEFSLYDNENTFLLRC